MANILRAGEKLTPGQRLQSPNGQYELIFQTDGNLVLYKAGRAEWQSKTRGKTPGEAIMQTDGHFVLYSPGRVFYWGTRVLGFSDGRLVLDDDGSLMVLKGISDIAWKAPAPAPTPAVMGVADMKALVDKRLRAEDARDIEAMLAVYTADIEHDVIGCPTGPTVGKDAARAYYQDILGMFQTEGEQIKHEYATSNALALELVMTVTVISSMFGVPGNNRKISFRALFVFEFRDGLISRENVWLDVGSVIAQLSTPATDAP